jgi:hypothetical protein
MPKSSSAHYLGSPRNMQRFDQSRQRINRTKIPMNETGTTIPLILRFLKKELMSRFGICGCRTAAAFAPKLRSSRRFSVPLSSRAANPFWKGIEGNTCSCHDRNPLRSFAGNQTEEPENHMKPDLACTWLANSKPPPFAKSSSHRFYFQVPLSLLSKLKKIYDIASLKLLKL